MRRHVTRRQRERLRGWWRIVPFVVIPLGVLFVQVWMNIQIIHNDYRHGELKERIRQVEKNILDLRNDRASMETVQQMEALTPDLGLVEPRYEQIRIVRESPSDTNGNGVPREPEYTIASAPPSSGDD